MRNLISTTVMALALPIGAIFAQGIGNNAEQLQEGNDNIAGALQIGMDNDSYQHQYGATGFGDRNEAYVVQLGADNAAEQYQRRL